MKNIDILIKASEEFTELMELESFRFVKSLAKVFPIPVTNLRASASAVSVMLESYSFKNRCFVDDAPTNMADIKEYFDNEITVMVQNHIVGLVNLVYLINDTSENKNSSEKGWSVVGIKTDDSIVFQKLMTTAIDLFFELQDTLQKAEEEIQKKYKDGI